VVVPSRVAERHQVAACDGTRLMSCMVTVGQEVRGRGAAELSRRVGTALPGSWHHARSLRSRHRLGPDSAYEESQLRVAGSTTSRSLASG
jgi:tartrate dehydratase alpha subunit/fumarate hydratase class I-like protein